MRQFIATCLCSVSVKVVLVVDGSLKVVLACKLTLYSVPIRLSFPPQSQLIAGPLLAIVHCQIM